MFPYRSVQDSSAVYKMFITSLPLQKGASCPQLLYKADLRLAIYKIEGLKQLCTRLACLEHCTFLRKCNFLDFRRAQKMSGALQPRARPNFFPKW